MDDTYGCIDRVERGIVTFVVRSEDGQRRSLTMDAARLPDDADVGDYYRLVGADGEVTAFEFDPERTDAEHEAARETYDETVTSADDASDLDALSGG